VPRRIVLVSFFLLPLVACGQAAGTGKAATASPASASPAGQPTGSTPASTPVPRPSSSSAAEQLTGTQYAYLKSADLAKRTITFDLVEWFEGKAAVAACQADGIPPADDGWCTDWYVRNKNKKLRTYPVAAGASLRIIGATGTQLVAADLGKFRTTLLSTERVFVFTVRAGQITKADEIYTP